MPFRTRETSPTFASSFGVGAVSFAGRHKNKETGSRRREGTLKNNAVPRRPGAAVSAWMRGEKRVLPTPQLAVTMPEAVETACLGSRGVRTPMTIPKDNAAVPDGRVSPKTGSRVQRERQKGSKRSPPVIRVTPRRRTKALDFFMERTPKRGCIIPKDSWVMASTKLTEA